MKMGQELGVNTPTNVAVIIIVKVIEDDKRDISICYFKNIVFDACRWEL